jgi:uncharacterized membrane protein YqhA
MSHVAYSGLKLKLLASIVTISAIDLLKALIHQISVISWTSKHISIT